MPVTIPSLWTKSLDSSEVAPIEVLRSQIAPVKEMTKGLIEGEILTWSGNDGFIYYLFDLVAPKLNLARHCLLAASHPQGRLYPVTVQAEGLKASTGRSRYFPEVGAEASGTWSIHFVRDRAGNSDWPQAKNAEELVVLLGKVLQSEAVTLLMRTIVARSLKAG